MSEGSQRAVLLATAAVHVTLAAWMTLSPGSFHGAVADFGPRNDHDLRDLATFYAAFAIALGLAVRRPSWRVPVLVLVAVQYALHTVNHLADVAEADPGWVGPADAASLAAAAALFGWLAWRAGAARRARRARR